MMRHLALLIFLSSPLLLQSMMVDKSASYTMRMWNDTFWSLDSVEKFEKCYNCDVDTIYLVPSQCRKPIYDFKKPVSVFLFGQGRKPNFTSLQQWFFQKTKKKEDLLIFACLYDPQGIVAYGLEQNFLSHVNAVGQDTSLTPGFALIKGITHSFKNLEKITYTPRKAELGQRLLQNLELLKKIVATHFDVNRYTNNYCLRKDDGELSWDLFESKHNKVVRPIDYLKAWHENIDDKYYKNDSHAIKNLVTEIYTMAYRSSIIARHFGIGPLVPPGKFKVTAAYADCVVVRESE